MSRLPERDRGLRVRWSKRERDLVFWHDRHKPDVHLLHVHLSPLAAELDKRGFDIRTLKFSIGRKAETMTPVESEPVPPRTGVTEKVRT